MAITTPNHPHPPNYIGKLYTIYIDLAIQIVLSIYCKWIYRFISTYKVKTIYRFIAKNPYFYENTNLCTHIDLYHLLIYIYVYLSTSIDLPRTTLYLDLNADMVFVKQYQSTEIVQNQHIFNFLKPVYFVLKGTEGLPYSGRGEMQTYRKILEENQSKSTRR